MSNRALVGLLAVAGLIGSANAAVAQGQNEAGRPAVVEPAPADDAAVVAPLRLTAEVKQAVLRLEQMPRMERPVAPPRTQPSTVALNSLYVSNAVLHALDVHSTLTGMRSGAAEANPMMRGLVKSPGAFIAMKAAVSAGTIMAVRSVAKKNKVSAIIALAAVNTVYGAIVHHNYQIASQMR